MIRKIDKKAFKEVYVILSYLQDEDLEKIPEEVMEALEDNMDIDYEYEMNEEVDLESQETLPETRAILYNLFRDYLCETWQKEKIIRMQNEERQKKELIKKQKYGTDAFLNKTKNDENKEKLESKSTEIVKYKESFFKKIVNKIRRLF